MIDTVTLRSTPLHALHLELGARMVPFAGYEMPVQYPAGIMKEHLHTRSQAGLFDVSHMGQIRLSGVGAAAALERLVPADVIDLPTGMQRYALFTSDDGGILDDLMIANLGDHLFVVVNAACKEQDVAHLRAHIGSRCRIDVLDDRSLLALQGPEAAKVLASLAPEVAEMRFMNCRALRIADADCIVSRSGYTGEDGFEISVPNDHAERLARTLLGHPGVMAIGLGARDSLRLEAGLCLYGHDMDGTTSPIEASLGWALSRARRRDGFRPGGYLGADAVSAHVDRGVDEKRVGLLPKDKVPVREGVPLQDGDGVAVGRVTSGGFGPSVGGPIAMGYVRSDLAKPGTVLQAPVRGKLVPVEVAATPFVPHRYFRG